MSYSLANLRKLRKVLETLRTVKADLQLQHALILILVALNKEVTAKEISDAGDITFASTSRGIHTLINEHDLLRLKANPADGRSSFVELSPKGERLMAELTEAL